MCVYMYIYIYTFSTGNPKLSRNGKTKLKIPQKDCVFSSGMYAEFFKIK